MVSVIVTSYNYGHYLHETLMSVQQQIFKDIECIVVDGGSTDNTFDVVNQFVKSDKRFSYIYQENKGVSAARNTGINKSNGDYIQFLDGDDILQKNKIASQVESFDLNPNADIIYGDVRFFDDKQPDIWRNSLKGDKPINWLPEISGRDNDVLKYLRSYNFLVTHSPLIKRSVIEKVIGFDEKIFALEDWDFWLRCAIYGAYFHYHSANDDLTLVRVHENSLSKRKDLMLIGNFQMLQKQILDSYTKIGLKIFFMIKHAELFWDTLFSKSSLPFIPFIILLLSVLMFPVWALIKFMRLTKLM